MPKINVYLPDDLAEAVKEAGVPVSAVCQRALEQAVRRITAIRQTALTDLDLDQATGSLAYMTARTRAVLKLAVERARADGSPAVGTGHLLGGMLAEGTNLALHVLRAIEIEPRAVERLLAGQPAAEGDDPAGDDGLRLSSAAAAALEFAVTEATSLGHNYIGCEHLLLGLATEPDGIAGRVLRPLGAEPRPVRRAVVAALAGYVHLRAQTQNGANAGDGDTGGDTGGAAGAAQPPAAPAALVAALRTELRPLAERIERLERHAGLPAED
ncbi:Clp protease N-terminal domain-containing protein [Nonomuraea muscovyensis]|uniref:Clp protease N-terminal domain-containing protein n=1 Tax=Nonomuraea muscovyensis TaxID=1124761 RepID=UPI0033EE5542|nr:ATPase with chaperone ATP-binding subunit-like protein [Nonomuraea muscovyensis]